MRTAPFPLAVVTLLATVALAAPLRAAPEGSDVDEARARFSSGVQLFHEGSFDAALAAFRKAYQLAPSYRVLFNIARVQLELHDHVGALRSFRQYLADGGSEVPPERRAQVEDELRKLEQRVCTLEIAVSVDGAELQVDDLPVGRSPLPAPLLVNAGVRRVTASKPGRVTTAQSVTVAGGDRARVELTLPEAMAARPLALSAPPAAAAERPRTRMWVALATTAALGVGAGTFALVTRQAKLDFESQLATFPNTKDSIDRARRRMVVDAAITDGLAGATLISGALTVYFALSHAGAEPETGRKRAQVHLAPTPGGLVVHGRF
jgi:tetratricopeptide (TPR) repeat protein